ncbi:MAG: NAD(P)H-quinone oxidoreductase [Desulfarculaceae bacterium]|nr:NAD(P)H-quinone oxidoreductase [Desulfarculaceae bacterium]MCF8073727.1 NAD(P)H-quinone oxidoreductase [Desulfarculaceae bacterium]MCF8101968.1 NAD(P)H-quinone oxidoreductase [Desulfarculaceae bacterium]MCF8115938.1 NAD(P)H-quinone oxidoreductase [Desulfarculaceae bacterium]
MQAILLREFGGPEQMYLGEAPEPVLKEREVLVKVKAAGVNRADTLQRKGLYPPPPGESEIMGLEVAGEVVALGPGCTRSQVGDKVFGIVSGGGYAELCAIDESLAMPIPEGLEFSQAAGMAEVFLTAHQALFWLCGLEAGEWALIHAGASGVGTAATQLARAAGAKVMVTAGSEAKLAACQALGARVGINYKQQDFVAAAKKATNDAGPAVIIDFIGGDYFQRNLETLALDGRMVMLATIGGGEAEKVNLRLILGKRLKVMGSTLRSRTLAYRAELTADLSQRWLPLFTQGKLRPVIDSVIPWDQAASAHERMEANLNTGKIILAVD